MTAAGRYLATQSRGGSFAAMFPPGAYWLGLCAVVFAADATAQRRVPLPTPDDVTLVEDVQYAEGFAREPRRNRLDLYVPKRVAKPPLVMFVHGGAWTGGSKEGWGRLAHGLCARGFAFAAINTQMNPFAEPSDMVADCGRAMKWLHDHAGEHGFDGERLWMMGHSSGAHLVTWLAFDEARLAASGVPRAAVQGVIGLSGVYEMRSRHLVLDKVFGEDPAIRRDATPLVHVSPGDPPAYLLWGEHDMACLSLCGRMLQHRLQEVGVPVAASELPGADHVGYVLHLGAPGEPVLDAITAFLRKPPPAPPRVVAEAVVPTTGTLAATLPCEWVRGTAPARASCVWLCRSDDERTIARAMVDAMLPHRVAFVMVDAKDALPAAVAQTFLELRRKAIALGLPAPEFLGGLGESGLLAATTSLGVNDGLRGRIVVGSPLGFLSIGKARPGQVVPDVPGLLAAGTGARPSLLLVTGELDAKVVRNECLQIAMVLGSKGVAVHMVEVPDHDSPLTWRRLGSKDDVMAPMLRAFLVP